MLNAIKAIIVVVVATSTMSVNVARYEKLQEKKSEDLKAHELYVEEKKEEEYLASQQAKENTQPVSVSSTEQGTGTFQLTAYTWTGNPMANGEYPYVGACASNYFSLGTVIYIEGYGTYTVCDRGNMASNVIDIYMNTEEECINFGRRYGVNVTVVN